MRSTRIQHSLLIPTRTRTPSSQLMHSRNEEENNVLVFTQLPQSQRILFSPPAPATTTTTPPPYDSTPTPQTCSFENELSKRSHMIRKQQPSSNSNHLSTSLQFPPRQQQQPTQEQTHNSILSTKPTPSPQPQRTTTSKVRKCSFDQKKPEEEQQSYGELNSRQQPTPPNAQQKQLQKIPFRVVPPLNSQARSNSSVNHRYQRLPEQEETSKEQLQERQTAKLITLETIYNASKSRPPPCILLVQPLDLSSVDSTSTRILSSVSFSENKSITTPRGANHSSNSCNCVNEEVSVTANDIAFCTHHQQQQQYPTNKNRFPFSAAANSSNALCPFHARKPPIPSGASTTTSTTKAIPMTASLACSELKSSSVLAAENQVANQKDRMHTPKSTNTMTAATVFPLSVNNLNLNQESQISPVVARNNKSNSRRMQPKSINLQSSDGGYKNANECDNFHLEYCSDIPNPKSFRFIPETPKDVDSPKIEFIQSKQLKQPSDQSSNHSIRIEVQKFTQKQQQQQQLFSQASSELPIKQQPKENDRYKYMNNINKNRMSLNDQSYQSSQSCSRISRREKSLSPLQPLFNAKPKEIDFIFNQATTAPLENKSTHANPNTSRFQLQLDKIAQNRRSAPTSRSETKKQLQQQQPHTQNYSSREAESDTDDISIRWRSLFNHNRSNLNSTSSQTHKKCSTHAPPATDEYLITPLITSTTKSNRNNSFTKDTTQIPHQRPASTQPSKTQQEIKQQQQQQQIPSQEQRAISPSTKTATKLNGLVRIRSNTSQDYDKNSTMLSMRQQKHSSLEKEKSNQQQKIISNLPKPRPISNQIRVREGNPQNPSPSVSPSQSITISSNRNITPSTMALKQHRSEQYNSQQRIPLPLSSTAPLILNFQERFDRLMTASMTPQFKEIKRMIHTTKLNSHLSNQNVNVAKPIKQVRFLDCEVLSEDQNAKKHRYERGNYTDRGFYCYSSLDQTESYKQQGKKRRDQNRLSKTNDSIDFAQKCEELDSPLDI